MSAGKTFSGGTRQARTVGAPPRRSSAPKGPMRNRDRRRLAAENQTLAEAQRRRRENQDGPSP